MRGGGIATETERQRDGDRQTYRQTDIQTDRNRQTERERLERTDA